MSRPLVNAYPRVADIPNAREWAAAGWGRSLCAHPLMISLIVLGNVILCLSGAGNEGCVVVVFSRQLSVFKVRRNPGIRQDAVCNY